MTHESLSSEEMATLKELQAKQKRILRALKADERFFAEADKRKEELLVRWGLTTVTDSQSSDIDENLSDVLESLSYDLSLEEA